MTVPANIINGSTPCEIHVKLILDSLIRKEAWALDFLDTWGFQSGNLHYNNLNAGLFTECVNFHKDEIQGKYCTVITNAASTQTPSIISQFGFSNAIHSVFDNKIVNLHNSICVPESCSPIQIRMLGNRFLVEHQFHWYNVKCYDPPKLNKVDIIVIFVLLIPILLTSLSTLYEILKRRSGSPPKQLFTSFSLLTNFKELIRISESQSSINCIDALKFLSAIWIIVGHRKGFMQLNYSGRHPGNSLFESYLVKFVARYFYSVDTFLTCSAILVTLSLLRAFERGNFSLKNFYWSRYLRFFATVGILDIFMMSSLPSHIVEGPLFEKLSYEERKCQEYWLPSLLFIQNYVNKGQTCLNHTWYLSTDLQLFFISPLVVFIMFKLGKRSLPMIIGAVMLCQIATYHHIHGQKFDSIGLYEQSQFRLGQYLVGIITGYLIYMRRCQKSPRKLNKFLAFTGWTLSLGFLYSQIFTRLSSKFSASFYSSVHRECWSSSICWIIYACHCFESGKFLRKFLSQSFWQPLSKMCLSIYLTHYIYISLTHFNQKERQRIDPWWQFHIYTGDIVVCFFIGGFFYLVVEAPTSQVVQFFLCRNSKQKTESGESGETEKLVNAIDS